MIGTLDNVKVRVRCHNPKDVKSAEFNGTKSIDEAIKFLNEVR